MSSKRNNTVKLDALLVTVTDDLFNGEVVEQFQAYGLRVERILLELVRSDPVQPPARITGAAAFCISQQLDDTGSIPERTGSSSTNCCSTTSSSL